MILPSSSAGRFAACRSFSEPCAWSAGEQLAITRFRQSPVVRSSCSCLRSACRCQVPRFCSGAPERNVRDRRSALHQPLGTYRRANKVVSAERTRLPARIPAAPQPQPGVRPFFFAWLGCFRAMSQSVTELQPPTQEQRPDSVVLVLTPWSWSSDCTWGATTTRSSPQLSSNPRRTGSARPVRDDFRGGDRAAFAPFVLSRR